MKQNTLMLVLILSGWILAGFYCAALPNNEDKTTDSKVKIESEFIYQQELKEDSTYELIAYPKSKYSVSKKTSYQFDIIHMTDSIKVYDGLRYVGQCAEKDLETLILNDNQ